MNTAFAFVAVGESQAPIFGALARAVERRVGDFKPQRLANTKSLFAKAGQLDAQLFAAWARAAERHVALGTVEEKLDVSSYGVGERS